MNRRMLIAAAAALVAFDNTASALLVNPTPGVTTVTENFNGLAATTFSQTIGTKTPIAGTIFDGTKRAGTGSSATSLTFDSGSGNSGGLYAYRSATGAETALGALASGSNAMAFGFQLTNNTHNPITQVKLTFTQEAWRRGSGANTISASWSTTAGASNYLTATTGFTSIPALDLTLAGGTNAALPGNTTTASRTATIVLSNALKFGQSFFIRWQDVDDSGTDAGLAIDNLTVEITAIPEPTAALFGSLLAGAFGLTVARRPADRD